MVTKQFRLHGFPITIIEKPDFEAVKIRLHFDNEHEWEPGKTMRFLLPVRKKELSREWVEK